MDVADQLGQPVVIGPELQMMGAGADDRAADRLPLRRRRFGVPAAYRLRDPHLSDGAARCVAQHERADGGQVELTGSTISIASTSWRVTRAPSGRRHDSGSPR